MTFERNLEVEFRGTPDAWFGSENILKLKGHWNLKAPWILPKDCASELGITIMEDHYGPIWGLIQSFRRISLKGQAKIVVQQGKVIEEGNLIVFGKQAEVNFKFLWDKIRVRAEVLAEIVPSGSYMPFEYEQEIEEVLVGVR